MFLINSSIKEQILQMFIHYSLQYNMKAHVEECIMMMAHSYTGYEQTRHLAHILEQIWLHGAHVHMKPATTDDQLIVGQSLQALQNSYSS